MGVVCGEVEDDTVPRLSHISSLIRTSDAYKLSGKAQGCPPSTLAIIDHNIKQRIYLNQVEIVMEQNWSVEDLRNNI